MQGHGALRGPARPADPPSPAAERVRSQDEQAQRDQHERERAGGRDVEQLLELGEDLGREGLVAEDVERPVLGQQDHDDEQAAAEDGHLRLPQRDAEEGLDPAGAEAARHLFLRRVGVAEAGRDRQVDQRVDRQRHHQNRAAEARHIGADRRPPEAHHEIGNRQRHHQKHRPHPSAGQVGALRQPRRAGPDDRAQRGDHDAEPDGVPQQLLGELAIDQGCDLAHSGAGRLGQQERQRHEEHGRHQDGQDQQPARQFPARARSARLRAVRRAGRPGTGQRPVPGDRGRHSSPAWRSREIAVEPSPRSAMLIGYGWRSANGVSGAEVVTPSSSGYS